MQRRDFLKTIGSLSALGLTATLIEGCAEPAQDKSKISERDDNLKDMGSFGYYQGLGPNEERSSSRTDGTSYNMPCISAADIEHGQEKIYTFWHGHSNANHKFTVKSDEFTKLRNGEDLEIFTDIIDGHRHSLRISKSDICESVGRAGL